MELAGKEGSESRDFILRRESEYESSRPTESQYSIRLCEEMGIRKGLAHLVHVVTIVS